MKRCYPYKLRCFHFLEVFLLFLQSDDQLLAKMLEGGYAVFDSASGWKTKPEYLDCLIVDIPIAYSEQVRPFK